MLHSIKKTMMLRTKALGFLYNIEINHELLWHSKIYYSSTISTINFGNFNFTGLAVQSKKGTLTMRVIP
jgi:hypothetical protein